MQTRKMKAARGRSQEEAKQERRNSKSASRGSSKRMGTSDKFSAMERQSMGGSMSVTATDYEDEDEGSCKDTLSNVSRSQSQYWHCICCKSANKHNRKDKHVRQSHPELAEQL